jgi:UDP-N-acetylglucosamine--N-acetylmuramyl-(pentapeptide) pyrophosphoryl-undecaprenol N-acetylglucosamine transferase
MAGAYAAADLVVGRSGATTVAELAVCGKRAVLVPFPFAADNHQEFNAASLAARGAAEVIVQKDLTPEKLAGIIKKYSTSGGAAGTARMENTAAAEIVRICKYYVQKN